MLRFALNFSSTPYSGFIPCAGLLSVYSSVTQQPYESCDRRSLATWNNPGRFGEFLTYTGFSPESSRVAISNFPVKAAIAFRVYKAHAKIANPSLTSQAGTVNSCSALVYHTGRNVHSTFPQVSLCFLIMSHMQASVEAKTCCQIACLLWAVLARRRDSRRCTLACCKQFSSCRI